MKWPSRFDIKDFTLGGGHAFVIAEAGVNHNGEVQLAHRLIDAAAEAKADAVKFQTFRPELVVSAAAPKAAYQRRMTDAAESQIDMLRKLTLRDAEYAALARHAADKHLIFLSTPFDLPSVELLERLDLPAYKIASGEVTNPQLLRRIAKTGRPALLSTGMSDLAEVTRAVEILGGAGTPALALLHCVSNYPASPEDSNLRAMATLAAAFAVPVGHSDHSPGIEVALAAVALGAAVIEKHLTLDCGLPGPDHRASLDVAGFTHLVAGVRMVESALGDGTKEPRPAEADTRRIARRSLFLCANVAAGRTIAEDDLIALRPGTGFAAERLHEVVGCVATRDLAAGQMLNASDFAP